MRFWYAVCSLNTYKQRYSSGPLVANLELDTAFVCCSLLWTRCPLPCPEVLGFKDRFRLWLHVTGSHASTGLRCACLKTCILTVASVLQNDAAVFRTQETLENGCKDIDDCVASFEDVGIQDRSMVWNTDLCETLELENLLCNAAVTMHSAEARKVGHLLIMWLTFLLSACTYCASCCFVCLSCTWNCKATCLLLVALMCVAAGYVWVDNCFQSTACVKGASLKQCIIKHIGGSVLKPFAELALFAQADPWRPLLHTCRQMCGFHCCANADLTLCCAGEPRRTCS